MKKKVALVSLLAGFSCVCASIVGLNLGAQAETATLDGVDFQAEYTLFSQVEIPVSQISYKNQQYDATVKVVQPDGTACIVGNEEFQVEQVGVYKVIYYAVVGGDYVSVEKEFTVSNRSVSFDGDKSSYYYGADETYSTATDGTPLNGIVVSLAQGETMYYNRIIDLKELAGQQVFSMFTAPEAEPLQDVEQLCFTFTDVYDPTNYVVVRVKANSSEAASNNKVYCDTKASVHSWHAGMEPYVGDVAVSIAGGSYAVTHDSIEYGSPITYSLGGYIASSRKLGDIQYGVEFDLETNFVYSVTNLQKVPIADLDHPLCFDTPWGGFTTGEVFLSVTGASFNSATAGIVFTYIAGHDLSAQDFHTEKKPLVTVDFGEYDKNSAPNAFVGENYKIFPATAYDVYDGDLRTVTKVYYGYHTNNPTRVGVVNGAFKPNREGVYTIEYSAVNAKGLKTVYTLDINAVSSNDKLNVELDGKLTTLGVGDKGKIVSDYELINVSGHGKTKITVILKGNESVRYDIGEDLIFQPLYTGTYTITFEISDYLFEKTETFECTVTAEGGKPIIQDTPKLPHYLIKGKQYTLPDLYGYELRSGSPILKKCDVYVEEEGKARQLLPESVYTPTAGTEATFVYVLSDGVATAERKFDVSIVDTKNGGSFNTASYFVSAQGTSATTSSSVELYANADAEWEFINLLAANKVEWRIRTVQGQLNFEYMYFRLEDAVESNRALTVALTRNGDLIDVIVNGESRAIISKSFTDFTTKDLAMSYEDAFSLFTIDGSTQITVNKYADGKDFEGFPSGHVVWKAGVSGVTGNAKIAIRKINNQNIPSLSADNAAPLVYYTSIRGYRTIGDKVTFAVATPCDVLDPEVSFTWYVMNFDGEYVRADDGTLLDGTQAMNKAYVYTITKLGTFDVVYEAKDSNGKGEEYGYAFQSVDTAPPTIELSNVVRKGNVGDKITVANYVISDNSGTDNIQTYVFVIASDGQIQRITGKTFDAKKAGNYTVQIFAMDVNGNIAIESYEVNIA